MVANFEIQVGQRLFVALFILEIALQAPQRHPDDIAMVQLRSELPLAQPQPQMMQALQILRPQRAMRL